MIEVETYGAAVGAAKRYTDEHSGSDDAVKYTEQDLTAEQQAQARTNIGAGTSSFSGNYSDLTNPPPLVKGTGTGGNTIGGTGGTAMNSAKNLNSYAYGYLAGADANYAFAFGERAFAGNSNHNTGKHAVAIGNNVSAEKDYEIAYGKFNQSNADTAFSIGDGTDTQNRHNLIELKTDGTLLLNGNAVKTEDATDNNKLRLGQIWNSDSSGDQFPKYGFYRVFAIGYTFSGLQISATEIVDHTSVGATFRKFGDFCCYRLSTSATTAYLQPLGGRTAGKPTTGTWILVENCFRMFYSCYDGNFTSLDISMFDTSECRDMTQMFYECTALTTLDISSFDMTNVIAYDKMFGEESHWAGITTLKCPKINPHDNIPLPRTLYSQDGTAYTNLPVTTGTSIELRQSWT